MAGSIFGTLFRVSTFGESHDRRLPGGAAALGGGDSGLFKPEKARAVCVYDPP